MSIDNPWPDYDFPLGGASLRPSEVNPETVIVDYIGSAETLELLMEQWSSAMTKCGWQEVDRLEGESEATVMHMMFRRKGSLAQLTFETASHGVSVAVSL